MTARAVTNSSHTATAMSSTSHLNQTPISFRTWAGLCDFIKTKTPSPPPLKLTTKKPLCFQETPRATKKSSAGKWRYAKPKDLTVEQRHAHEETLLATLRPPEGSLTCAWSLEYRVSTGLMSLHNTSLSASTTMGEKRKCGT